MKYKFELDESSRANTVWLVLNFAGGDADTEHPEEVILEGITPDNIQFNEDKIDMQINQYKQLTNILDVNHKDHINDRSRNGHKVVKEKYGEEMADLYDLVPNDPQSDYQYKCYLSSIELIKYDDKSNKYKAYV